MYVRTFFGGACANDNDNDDVDDDGDNDDDDDDDDDVYLTKSIFCFPSNKRVD